MLLTVELTSDDNDESNDDDNNDEFEDGERIEERQSALIEWFYRPE